MSSDEELWVYPQHARRVGGHYEIPGSRGSDRAVIILDRDITPLVPDRDPQKNLQANRRLLQETAQRLFDEGFVSKVADNRAPQFFHWQVVITRADLERTAGGPLV
jgi:hypothetical protein